eukprot:scaffold535_cov260-Pinguiococcus_pyrenoidosus.AAC.44
MAGNSKDFSRTIRRSLQTTGERRFWCGTVCDNKATGHSVTYSASRLYSFRRSVGLLLRWNGSGGGTRPLNLLQARRRNCQLAIGMIRRRAPTPCHGAGRAGRTTPRRRRREELRASYTKLPLIWPMSHT